MSKSVENFYRGGKMRRYYLHTRKNGIFYAELVTSEGNKLTARSTGTKSRDEALLIIAKWLESGIPTGRVRKPAAAIEGRIAYHIDKLYQKGIIAARYSCMTSGIFSQCMSTKRIKTYSGFPNFLTTPVYR
jgi:hypothetical protein